MYQVHSVIAPKETTAATYFQDILEDTMIKPNMAAKTMAARAKRIILLFIVITP